MTKKILVLLSIVILFFPSFSARAFSPQNESENLINNLDSICKFKSEEKSFLIEKLKEAQKKDNTIDNQKLHNTTVEIQKKCVYEDLNSRDKEQTYDHDKLKTFLTLIKPIRDKMGSSTQFLSYGAGVWTSQVILQLNSFITPDNWVSMPDITGRSSADDDLNTQFKNAFLGNPSPKNRIVNIDPLLSQFLQYFYVLSFGIGVILVLLALFKKDKTGWLGQNMSRLGLKFFIASTIPIILSFMIIVFNFCSLLITESIPKIDTCSESKGITCLVTESAKDLYFADFYKLEPEKLIKKDENKLLGIFNAGEAFDFAGIGWWIYYFVIFGLIAGSALFFGSMFMTAQVTIFFKLCIWYIVAYANLLNHKSDFIEMIQELTKLILESLGNIFGFSFVLFIVFQILKGSFELYKLSIIVALLLSGSAYFGYFYILLKIKRISQKNSAFQYKDGLKAGINKIGKTKSYVQKRVQQSKKNITNIFNKFKKQK